MKGWKVVAGILALAGILAIVMLIPRPERDYEFELSEVSDPKDVQKLLSLDEELRKLSDWTPPLADSAELISEFIGLNPDAGEWGDLLRSHADGSAGEDEEIDPELLKDESGLPAYNAGILALMENFDAAELKRLQALGEAERLEQVRAALAEAAEQRRRDLVSQLVESPGFAATADQFQLPDFPAEEEKREAWIERFSSAVSDEVGPMSEWYEKILSYENRIVPALEKSLGDSPSRLVLRPARDGNGKPLVEFKRGETVADFDVVLFSKTLEEEAEAPFISRDTGLRVRGLGFKEGPEGVEPDPAGLANGSATFEIDPEPFQQLTSEFGLPKGFFPLGADSLSSEGAAKVKIGVSLRRQQLPDFVAESNLAIDLEDADPEASIRGQVEKFGESALADFREFLDSPGKKSFNGTPVEISAIAGEDSRYKIGVEIEPWPALHFEADLFEDGRLEFAKSPPMNESTAFSRALVGSSEVLAPTADFAMVSELKLAQGLKGELWFRDPDPNALTSYFGPVEWAVSPKGEATFFDVDSVRDQVARSGSDHGATGGEPEFKLDELQGQLEAAFPDLAPFVELGNPVASTSGTRCGAVLKIADWPELSLGPVYARDAAQMIENLLSERTVLAAAGGGWKSGPHPRFEIFQSTLSGWDPEAATAKIQTTITLGSVKKSLSWEEDVVLENGAWSHFGSEQICEAIGVKALEPLESRIKSLTGDNLSVRVQRDAFGEGVWLQTRPLTIKLDVGLDVPFLEGVHINLGSATIGAKELDWPDEYALQWKNTVPTPWVNISDPAVTVELDRQSLRISGRLTPPFPTGLRSAGPTGMRTFAEELDLPIDTIDNMRVDNPWLHAMYFDTRIEGSLKEAALAAQTDLVLLDAQPPAVRAGGVANWEQKFLTISAEVSPFSSESGMFYLAGEIDIRESEGLNIDGLASVGNFELDGYFHLDPPSTDVGEGTEFSPGFDFQARTRLPVVDAPVRVRGASNINFSNYQFGAAGHVPLGSKTIYYELDVDDEGWMFNHWWRTADGGIAPASTYGPTSSWYDSAEDREQLQRLMNREFRGLSPEESRVVREHPKRSLASQMEVRVPNPIHWAPTVTSGGMTWKGVSGTVVEIDGSRVNIFGSDSKPLLKLKADSTLHQIGLLKEGLIRDHVRTKNGYHLFLGEGGGRLLLVFDEDEKKIHALECENSTSHGGAIDLTEKYTDLLGPIFPMNKTRRQVIAEHFLLERCGWTLTEPRKFNRTNYWVEAATNPAAPRFFIFYWLDDEDVRVAISNNAIANPDWFTQENLEAISRAQGGDSKVWVVEASDDRISTLTRSKTSGEETKHRFKIGASESKAIVVEAIFPEDALMTEGLGSEAAHWLARAIAEERISAECEFYCGSEGFAAWDGDGLHLVHRSRILEDGAAAESLFVSRAAFVTWDSESVRLLPEKLRTAEERGVYEFESLAPMLVSPWRKQEGDPTAWGAEPLGLFESLARKVSQ